MQLVGTIEKEHFPWKRYWAPVGYDAQLLDDGYLWEPKSDKWNVINNSLKTLVELRDIPCLILLGEPGLGKSFELACEAQSVAGNDNQKVYFVNLPDCEDNREIREVLSEPFELFRDPSNDARLCIFIDGADENILRATKFVSILGEMIKLNPRRAKSLRVRIACRIRQWNAEWEPALRKIWPADNDIQQLLLAPLTRRDVKEAAGKRGLDSEKFDKAIAHKDLTVFARKPVTLLLLLSVFANDEQFPQSQVALYQRGCRELCLETPGERRDRFFSLGTKLTADEKIAVAARIAYVSIFSGKNLIKLDNSRSRSVANTVLEINCLHGETEFDGTTAFEVTPRHVYETVVESNLFEANSDSEYAWSQQTYADFLAAHYLSNVDFSAEKILNLIVQNGKVMPQITETVGWLAVMRSDVFDQLLISHPEFLFSDDKQIVDNARASKLLDALIAAYKVDDVSKRLWRSQLRKFSIVLDLDQKIRPLLKGKSVHLYARMLALDLADSCRLLELQEEIAAVALNSRIDYRARKLAACVVQDIGESDVRKKMLPLTKIKSTEDPEGELLGYSLLAVYPNHLTTKELFARLVESFEGIAGGFSRLLGALPELLREQDIVEAMSWVSKQYQVRDVPLNFKRLSEQIILKAMEYSNAPQILEKLGDIVLARRQLHDYPVQTFYQDKYRKLLDGDQELRFRLLNFFLGRFKESNRASAYAFWLMDLHFANSSDVPRLGQMLDKTSDEPRRQVLLNLITFLYRLTDEEHYELYLQNELVRQTVAIASDISSESATEFRERQRRYDESQRKRELPLPDTKIKAFVQATLTEAEAVDLTNWWRIPMALVYDAHGLRQGSELDIDLTQTPGWKLSDDKTRERIERTGKAFLEQFEPIEQVGDNSFNWFNVAAHKAAYMLMINGDELSPNAKLRFARVAVNYPVAPFRDSLEHVELLKTVLPEHEDIVVQSIINEIDRDNRSNRYLTLPKVISSLWCDQLQAAILQILKVATVSEHFFYKLLDIALANGSKPALEFATNLVKAGKGSRKEKRTKAAQAAQCLAKNNAQESWPLLWSVLTGTDKFAVEVLNSFSRDYWPHNVLALKIDSISLADLCYFLVMRCPMTVRNKTGVVELVGEEQSLVMWRDSCLTVLADRGTLESVASLRVLQKKLPEEKWLISVIAASEDDVRRKQWVSFSAGELFSVAREKYRTVIRDGDQFLAALQSSLARLNEKLQGTTPAVLDLWNECYQHDYNPKYENRLSDYIARHLREDLKAVGIAALREIEVKPREIVTKKSKNKTKGSPSTKRAKEEAESPKKRTGQLLDIYVEIPILDRASKQTTTKLKAIVEVKCCFNDGLHLDMERQLLNRYLKTNKITTGLYVVACYHCSKLAPDKASANKHTLKSLDLQLSKQAADLSENEFLVKHYVLDAALN